MKIRIEITEESEEEVVIRTKELNDKVRQIEEAVRSISAEHASMEFIKDDKIFYLELGQILFFETSEKSVCAHTVKDVYETKSKLYELERVLPANFIRVSKSTILNVNQVYSVSRNLTASSIVEFRNTYKKVYVSRNYYKAMMSKIEEKRF